MISRRALTSLRQQAAASAHKSKTIIPRSSASTHSSTSPNLSLFTYSSLPQNHRRFSLKYLFSSSFPWDSDACNTIDNNGVLVVRGLATRSADSSSNRPPKETILLDGCDFEHWLVVMEPPDPNLTRDDIIDSYIKTLAQIVGSEEEARKNIYSVSTRHYFAFGALVSEELSYKMKELPRVRWVLPDSYLDVKNKNYGGEPFIDGQAVPYDPKYHEEWVRNNARANERSRRNDRPRNFDRSRNFERRRENTMNRDMPPPPPPSTVPNPEFQNQGDPSRGMPPPVQNVGFQSKDMPPVQNSGFQGKNMPPPVQNRDFQNNHTQPQMQSRDYPGREMNMPPPSAQNWNPQSSMQPPPAQNWNSQNRGMPPPPQNWNGQSNIPPPLQNSNVQSNMTPPPPNWNAQTNMPPPQQNWNAQTRDIPPPQNWNSQSRDTGMASPTQNWNSQGRDVNMGPPTQSWNSQGRDMNMPPASQNWNQQSRDIPASTQNQDFQGRDMRAPTQNWDTQTAGIENAPNVNSQSRDPGLGGGFPNQDQMRNTPSRDHQTRDTPDENYEYVANRNF